MAYKPEKYSKFLSEGYDLYLKKIHKGKETIKEVEIELIPIPAGKSLEDIYDVELPDLSPSTGPAIPYRPKSSSEPSPKGPERLLVPTKTTRPTEGTPKSAKRLIKVKADKLLWVTNSIKSYIADDLHYIKHNRAVSRQIEAWAKSKGLRKFLYGNGIEIRSIPGMVNLVLLMNTIELKHGDLKVTYNLGKPTFSALMSLPLTEQDFRLSSLFYHLSKRWFPASYEYYKNISGALKRFGERTPHLNIIFEESDGVGKSLAHVNVNREVMNFDILDYSNAFSNRENMKGTGESLYDNTVHHEMHHFFAKDGFIANMYKAHLAVAPGIEIYKTFVEGFAELWGGGTMEATDGIKGLIKDGFSSNNIKASFRSLFDEPAVNAFKNNDEFDYNGGGLAIVFLARKIVLEGNSKTIKDLFKDLNTQTLSESVESILNKYVSAYDSFQAFKNDFIANYVDVIYDVCLNSVNDGDQGVYLENTFLGGNGGVSKKEDLILDIPDIPREHFETSGDKLFDDSPEYPKYVQDVFGKRHNQIVYICEDLPDCTAETLKTLLKLPDVREAYCIVRTNSTEEVTDGGIKLYTPTNVNFSKTTIDGTKKTLYTMALNERDNFLDELLFDILNKIPNTVDVYDVPSEERAIENYYIVQKERKRDLLGIRPETRTVKEQLGIEP